MSIDRTTSIGLIRYASEFHDASLIVDNKYLELSNSDIEIPKVTVFYLMGHALELAFKAFLLHKGLSHKKLKYKYGHNLTKCLNAATNNGLGQVVQFSATDVEVIKILDYEYSKKYLEYITTGAKTYPTFGLLQALTKRLILAVTQYIGISGPFLRNDIV